jgi:hypothetical protein
MNEIDFVGWAGSFCSVFFFSKKMSLFFRSKYPTSALAQFIIAFYRFFLENLKFKIDKNESFYVI